MDMVTYSDGGIELISLTVAGQSFCIDIRSVREIRGWTSATPLPQAPDYVIGVINLRGAVMPVLDLQSRLGLGTTEISGRHVVVVVEEAGQLVGLVVEAVQETMVVQAETLQPPPNYAPGQEVYVDALIPREGEILGRLRVATLLPPEDMSLAA